jgi:hypothetical protein
MRRCAAAMNLLLSVALALEVCALSGCDDSIVINLRLSGLSPAADRLRITATQTRRAPDTWTELERHEPIVRDIGRDHLLDRVSISIPNPRWTGSVEFDVRQFVSGNNCTVGRGRTDVAVHQPHEQTVDLALSPTPGACMISVDLIGEVPGQITSEPPGISCPKRCDPVGGCERSTRCFGVFPAGTSVQIKPVSDQDSPSSFSNWLGACNGVLDCTLSVSADDLLSLQANFSEKQICNAGWCWENPRPTGTTLYGVHVAGPQEVWVVGERGLVLRWFGGRWQRSTLDLRERLAGVTRDRQGRIWTFSEGGAVWRREQSGTWRKTLQLAYKPRAIWTDGTDGVWLAGAGGSVTQLTPEGAAAQVWTLSAAELQGIGGTGPSDVWVVGESGTAVHWDGSRWSTVPTGVSNHLNALFSAAADRVWAVGDQGTALLWNGTAWEARPTGLPESIRSVWGGSASAWIVGDRGALLQWQGTRWQREPFPASSSAGLTLYGVHSGPDASPYAVGMGGVILRRSQGAWTEISRNTAPGSLNSIWVGDVNNVWAAGDDGMVWHWDGIAWRRMPSAPVGLSSILGFGTDDVWIAGFEGYVAQWQGGHWKPYATGTTGRVSTIWGATAAGIWGGTDDSRIIRREGDRFVTVKRVPTWVTSLWGSGDEAWGVGPNALIMHLKDGLWDQEPIECKLLTDCFFQDVTGSGANDVWTVSTSGAIFRRRNGIWRSVPSLNPLRFSKIWVPRFGEAWAVAVQGSILKLNEADAIELRSVGVPSSLQAIAGTRDRLNIWVAGTQNSILRYRPLTQD